MEINIKLIKDWIKVKRKDNYWTRGDDDGNMDCGKECCLDDLEEFINSQNKTNKSSLNSNSS